MARGRPKSPERIRAYEIWLEHKGEIKLTEIAAEIGVSDGQIRQWKKKDAWALDGGVIDNEKSVIDNAVTIENPKKKKGPPFGSHNARGHGAPKGNKNALGNKGGAPKRNKNARKTGLYETIWLDCLDENEKAIYEQIDTDEMVQVEQSIKRLGIIEYRMFARLRKLIDGATEKERRIVSECKDKGEIVFVTDEAGAPKMVYRDKPELVIMEITETEYRRIDDILRQEKALLELQGNKARQLALKHKLQMEQAKLQLERRRVEIMAVRAGDFGDKEDNGDAMQSFIDALKGQAAEVWDE